MFVFPTCIILFTLKFTWNSCVVTVAFLYCDTSLQSMAWDDDFDKIKIIWNEAMMKKKIPGLVGNMIMIKSFILIVRIMTVNICEKKKKMSTLWHDSRDCDEYFCAVIKIKQCHCCRNCWINKMLYPYNYLFSNYWNYLSPLLSKLRHIEISNV